MDNHRLRIVMLAGSARSSRLLYHALHADFDIVRVILEQPVSTSHFLKRRMKRLGLIKVSGQVLFMLCNKFIAPLTKPRIHQLLEDFHLKDHAFPPSILMQVRSVNHQEVITALQKIEPDAILINGTRLLSKKILSSIEAPFINTHMGITPKYRGVHGGYWALTQQDTEHCGVTVHLVDEGIDTGGILYQKRISVTDEDNFNTYPIHQLATAIPLIKAALHDISQGTLSVKPGVLPSQLWFHPTLYEYIKYRVLYGVK